MADIVLSILVAALMLAAAAYAQWRIPVFTKAGSGVAVSRLVLITVGIGLGLVSASFVQSTAEQMLAFVTGFGLVHVPAAVILYVKGKRRVGPS